MLLLKASVCSFDFSLSLDSNLFWTVDWPWVLSHRTWILRCETATLLIFLHRGQFFQAFTLQTKASASHDDPSPATAPTMAESPSQLNRKAAVCLCRRALERSSLAAGSRKLCCWHPWGLQGHRTAPENRKRNQFNIIKYLHPKTFSSSVNILNLSLPNSCVTLWETTCLRFFGCTKTF